ncbi:PncC family amidohydrolase [Erwinia persicina]|uniref:CinA family protein n=2 Tax=Erwinia TaxID=551 RepID=A0ABV4E388_9GAMM|nr:CinA family protein [Erwinia persicina]MCP1436920.1 PncC family amidohydrolase [Erwinia persicina]
MDKELLNTAERLGKVLLQAGAKVAAAESCTSGLVSSALGAASDSSSYFTSGFVTYTDSAKHRILHVSEKTLQEHTAVSEATAREMAAGAKEVSGEKASIAVTGYAGPDGGEDGTPAGTVWFGWGLPDGEVRALKQHFSGDCEEVVRKAALFALQHLTELLQSQR